MLLNFTTNSRSPEGTKKTAQISCEGLTKEINSTGRLYIFCGKGKGESKAGNESGRSSGQCDKRLHR